MKISHTLFNLQLFTRENLCQRNFYYQSELSRRLYSPLASRIRRALIRPFINPKVKVQHLTRQIPIQIITTAAFTLMRIITRRNEIHPNTIQRINQTQTINESRTRRTQTLANNIIRAQEVEIKIMQNWKALRAK